MNYSVAYDHVKISIPNSYICICSTELCRNYFSSSFTGSNRLVNRKYPGISSRKHFKFVLCFTSKIKLGLKTIVNPVASSHDEIKKIPASKSETSNLFPKAIKINPHLHKGRGLKDNLPRRWPSKDEKKPNLRISASAECPQ